MRLRTRVLSQTSVLTLGDPQLLHRVVLGKPACRPKIGRSDHRDGQIESVGCVNGYLMLPSPWMEDIGDGHL
jgi:hypothetical protein